MTFHESNNKNLLKRLVTGVLYTGIEQADTGQLNASGQPVNNPAADLEPGHLWVRVGDPERSAVVAWNGKINNQITNIPVYVGINRLTHGLEVIDLDLPRAAARFGSAVSSLYAQPSGDLSTTTTRGRNFKPGRVSVSSGLIVQAFPFFYKDSADAIKYWDGTGTLTLAAPAASGGVNTVRWTIVALNPDATTPTLVAITGTAQLVTLPILQIEDLAAIAITDGYYPLAAAKITTGDTTVLESSWIDFRLYFEKDGTLLPAPTISSFTNAQHNHTNAAGGGTLTTAAISDITTSTYTPALTGVANVSASTAYVCQYMRVGNVVSVSGKVDVDPTAAVSTQLGISLPVASNLANAEDCAGVAFSPTIAGQGAAILGDATNNRAQMEWIAVDVTNQPMYFQFQYEIL